MKKIKLLGLGLIVSLIVAFGIASVAGAAWSPNFRASDETVKITKDSTHEGSLYTAGGTVAIDGIVTGSVYCAGSVVTINGTVEGDVLCAGQKVTINGTVEGDVRVAGQFVQIGGSIGGSLTAFAQDVRLDRGSRVADDVNGAAQQYTLNGMVGRDVAVGTQLLALDGEVKGNVDVATEQVQVGNGASILGNLNYTAQKQLSFDESVAKKGVSFNPAKTGDHYQNGRRFFSAVKVTFLLMLVVSALAAVLVMPRFINRSSELFRRQMLMTILVGFAFLFGGPMLVGLLLFSIVLAPFGLALLFGWLAILLLSTIFFAYWVGAELLRSQSNIVVRMLGGIAVVVIVCTIPVLSALLLFVSVIVGSGMIVMTFTHGYRRPSYRIASKKKSVAK